MLLSKKILSFFPKAISVGFVLGEHSGHFVVRVDARFRPSAVLPQPHGEEAKQRFHALVGKQLGGIFNLSQSAHRKEG